MGAYDCDCINNLEYDRRERKQKEQSRSTARSTAQSTDLISRQDAIDALNEYFARIGKLKRRGLTEGEKAISLDTVGTIKTLPPAQPELHEGEWEQVSAQRYFMSASYFYRCSVCGENNPRNTKYCPNCGSYNGGGRK